MSGRITEKGRFLEHVPTGWRQRTEAQRLKNAITPLVPRSCRDYCSTGRGRERVCVPLSGGL